MKRLNINIAFLLSLCSLVLTSCLKDKDVDNGLIGIKVNSNQKIAEIAGSPTGFINVDVIGSPRDTTFTLVTVRLASENLPENDVQITLEPDASLVTAYNAANGTNYQAAPASAYQLSSLNVTIPKGKREGVLTLKAIPNNLFAALYAFGFRITAVSDPSITISGNFNKQVVALAVRNQYDGVYSVESGSVQRYTAPGAPTVGDALNGSLAGNPNVTLVTVNPNTVTVTGLQWAKAGGGVGGIDNLRATVNPATNAVSMSALGNATLANWEGKENRYDPATRTFYLNFNWNPTANRREYSIVLKYKGIRP